MHVHSVLVYIVYNASIVKLPACIHSPIIDLVHAVRVPGGKLCVSIYESLFELP